ncbi:MAG: hypothetical protein IKM18_03325 [Clostridia bacterium]|nr:hypothetical protein [Clostridia bacterium]
MESQKLFKKKFDLLANRLEISKTFLKKVSHRRLIIKENLPAKKKDGSLREGKNFGV